MTSNDVNLPHPWPLPVPTNSLARSRSETRRQALTTSPQTGTAFTRESRGSRRPLQDGQPAPPSQVARRNNLTSSEELPAVFDSMSPQMRPPITLPSSVQLLNTDRTPQGATSQGMLTDFQSTSSSFVVVEAQSSALAASSMSHAERTAMQSQIDALQQLQWTTNAAE